MTSRWRAAGLVFLVGLLWISSHRWNHPFGVGDEGYLYYIAEARLNGLLLYEDIALHSYMPGVFYSFTALFALTGPSIGAARIVMAAGLAVTPAVLTATLWHRLPRPLTLGLAATTLLLTGPWHKFYVGLLNALLIAALLAAWDRPDRRRLICLGAVTGAASMLRVDVALLSIPAFAGWLFLRGPWLGEPLRPLAAHVRHWLTGALLGTLPWAVPLILDGQAGAWATQVTGFGAAIGPRIGTFVQVVPPPFPTLEGGLHQRTSLLFWSSFLGPIALALALAAQAIHDRSPAARARMAVGVLVLGWTLGNLPQYALERPNVGHVMQHHAAILTAAAFAAVTLWRLARPLVLLPTVPLATFAVFAVLGSGGETLQRIELTNGRSFPDDPGAPLQPVVEAVLQRGEPRDPLFVGNYLPGIAWLADRQIPGRHVFWMPELAHRIPEAELVGALAGVDIAVVVPRRIAALPLLTARLREDFRVVRGEGRLKLLVRRGYRRPADPH